MRVWYYGRTRIQGRQIEALIWLYYHGGREFWRLSYIDKLCDTVAKPLIERRRAGAREYRLTRHGQRWLREQLQKKPRRKNGD